MSPTAAPGAADAQPEQSGDAPVRVRVRRRGPSRRERHRRRRRLLLLLAGALAALAAAVALDGWLHYGPALRALRDGRDAATQADALVRASFDRLDPAGLRRAESLLQAAAADLGPRSELLDTGWLAGVAAHLPFAGPQVEGLRELRHAAQAAVRLGADLAPLAADLATPARAPAAGAAPQDTWLSRLTGLAAGREAQLHTVSQDLDALDAAVGRLGDGSLLGPLRQARATLRRDTAQLDAAVRPALSLLGALPAAVGPGRHTYLLLLSNPAEERPGGGFLGAVGQVVFENGRLSRAQFRASDFANSLVRSLPAPRPLDDYLFHGTPWQLSDADWSPDFPTSAGDVAHFWELATGVHPDGVVEVDPVLLGPVLDLLGPVTVPPWKQEVVSGQDTLLQLNRIVNGTAPGTPGKAFLAPFGARVLDRLLHAPVRLLPGLAQALAEAGRTRHLLLHLDDPALQSLVAGAHLDGGLDAPLGDSLLVADANLGGGKTDLFVRRSFEATAHVADTGDVRDHLVLTYSNPAPTDPQDRALVSAAGGAYRDYLRVYLPEAAHLDSLQVDAGDGRLHGVSPEAVTYEHGREAVAYLLVVPRGSTARLVLDEHGPFADITRSPERYTLAWSKQPDALPAAVRVSVLTTDGVRHDWSSTLDGPLEFDAAG